MVSRYTLNILGGSFMAHVGFVLCLVYLGSRVPVAPPHMMPVKLRITQAPKPAPVAPKAEPVIKPQPLPKIVKHVAPPKSERKPTSTPVHDAVPVQGLSASALSTNGKGIAVPIGNTLLREDEGKRLKADEVKEMEQDMSAEASLIRSTFTKPPYSQSALFAQLQGTFSVLVFVDKEGNPVDMELPRKIGYDMDDPIRHAVLTARYYPKKDKEGQPLEGWTEIKIKLEIP